MFNKKIDFMKTFKPAIIIYAVVLAVSIIITLFVGVKLDINFSGGTRISYSYEGEISTDKVTEAVKTITSVPVTVSESTSIAGDTKTLTLSFAGKDSIDAEIQQKITSKLATDFKANAPSLYDSTSISATVASSFFIKTLVAVLLAAALVVVYVGIRFRKIGGVSAAITAFVALILDVLVAFFTCTVFGLPIDSNFMAVVLTILGYSLNDTIVIYDRVREGRRLEPNADLGDLVNDSVNSVMKRTVITTVTTLLAVFTIVVVSEFFGLSSLRSFAIPMGFGLISGCTSSLFISTPLWVIWKKHSKKSKKSK